MSKPRARPKSSRRRPRRTGERLLNQTQLAEAMGVTTRTIARWIPLGLPTRGTARSTRYHLPDVIQWYGTYRAEQQLPSDLAEAKRRREAAAAQLAELKLARERGDVIALETYEAEFGAAVEQLAAVLKGFAPRAAPKLVNLDGVVKVRAVLEPEVRRLMEQLSQAANGMPEPEEPVEETRKLLRVAG